MALRFAQLTDACVPMSPPSQLCQLCIVRSVGVPLLTRLWTRCAAQEEFDELLRTSSTVYVGNLTFYTTEEQIYEVGEAATPTLHSLWSHNNRCAAGSVKLKAQHSTKAACLSIVSTRSPIWSLISQTQPQRAIHIAPAKPERQLSHNTRA
jgi:hypothetical protein